jgi:NAD(P)-dependent dehydrogenase (short-subunit alcohol dehydrogenase family)
MRLKDKVAILTGASSGIGNATALRFAEEGAKVVVVARRAERLEELANASKELDGEIYPVPGDVSIDEDIEKVVEETLNKYGKIDILVNNAGILDNYLSADNMEDEIWDKVLDVNLTGPMKMIRKVIPHMIKQGSGNIINTASVGGLFGARGGMAYVASKHGLIGMTKHIGYMFQDKGIRCNAVAPGSVKTEIGGTVESPNQFVLDKLMKGVSAFPVVGEAEEIANVMLFLASDESSFVNGTTIVADGGWTAY